MNPIYYKIDGSTNIEILVKENEVSLKHDDQFGFLPDKCWFKISIKKSRLGTDNVEAASLMLRVRAVAELNDSQNFPEIIPQVGNNQQVEAASQAEVTSQNVIILPTPDFTFQVKREAEEANQAEEKSPKRQRTENPTSSSSISGNDEQQVPCQSSVSVSRFKTCFFFRCSWKLLHYRQMWINQRALRLSSKKKSLIQRITYERHANLALGATEKPSSIEENPRILVTAIIVDLISPPLLPARQCVRMVRAVTEEIPIISKNLHIPLQVYTFVCYHFSNIRLLNTNFSSLYILLEQ